MNILTEKLSFIIEAIGLNPTQEIFGNGLVDFAQAILLFVIFLAVFKVFQFFVLRYLKKLAEKTKTDIDDTLIEIIRSLKPPFYSFLAFYIAIQPLTFSSIAETIIESVLIIWITYQVIIGLQIFIDYLLTKRFSKNKDQATQSALGMIGSIVKGILWALGVLMILSNLGVNVTSLIAGLGIGGIAIAFALQNILGDLFSSFALYFDKPFVAGEFIVVGNHAGTVEKIGIKTTRIRSTTGEEITISNNELTTARIQNFKRLTQRRSIFSIGVVYETPVDKLKRIPNIIQKIIESKNKTNFDRVHFKSFGDSSLNFEVSYYVKTTEYAEFMDTQQEVNLNIVEAFGKEGIVFAYPTQTLYIAKES